MKKAIVIYQSRTGTTEALAKALASKVTAKGIDTKVCSIAQADASDLSAADILLFGCWTSGLFIVMQHPEKAWEQFARSLPPLAAQKIGLFTTYKLATGGMFKKMTACLEGKTIAPTLSIKSKSSALGKQNEQALEEWLNR